MTALQTPARKLLTRYVEKPWGVADLPSPFASDEKQIGEIWFEPPSGCPLLVKYLFTSERLSIQVHPDDEQARARGLAAGKEECWYVLAAEPGAQLGIGTVKPLDRGALQEAARTGTLEQLVTWHDVSAGMFFHIPPGTVHAIGGGVTLIEIQQNSDVTYRLYDYGRPRSLHLDDGAAVADAAPMSADCQRFVDPQTSEHLLDSAHLGVAHLVGRNLAPLDDAKGELMLVPLAGRVSVGGVAAGVGECLWAENGSAIEANDGARFLAAWFNS
jgi:mannose-6-phosphate isomerase